MGIGTPSSIPYFVLMGLGIGAPAPPVTVGGGGAVPIRGWNGREYWDGNSRGNVETVYRPNRTRLSPEPVKLVLTVIGKLTHFAPGTSKPSISVAEETVKAKSVTRTALSPSPIALILSLTGELDYVHPAISLHRGTSGRISTLEARLEELVGEVRAISKRNEVLLAELSSKQEEILDLEDQLLLGVN
jgi:hypothetical protein